MTERIVKTAWWVGEAIRDTASSVIAVTAGLGSGKTDGACRWFHRRVRDNVGASFSAFMEPTFQKVWDTAIPTYKKVLGRFGRIEGVHYRIVKSPFPKLIYLDQTHHEVHFLSAERPDTIAGVEYSHACEDEAGVNCIESRRNLRGRLYRDRTVACAQFLIVGAPQGINEFAEEFDSETIEGWDRSHPRDHTRTDLVEGVEIRKRRFILWTDDNPFVSPQYLAELQSTYGHNPNLIRSYRYGQFCPLSEGSAYANYQPQKHDVPDVDPDPYREIVLKWDFNASPLAWVSSQRFALDDGDRRILRWVAIHEANEGATTLDDSCVEFAVKHPVTTFRDTPIRLYGDRTGHAQSHKISGSDFEAIQKYLKTLGYRNVEIVASRAVAPEASSVDALNRLFLQNSLNICKRCRMLRKGLLATTWKKGTRKLDKPAGETHTHHPDAVKYWAWQERDTLTANRIIHGKN